MRILTHTIPAHWDGATVKAFAKGALGLSTRALAQQKYEGGILVNGIPCHANATLGTGDRLEFPLLAEVVDYPAAALPLTILYEDQDYLIVDKPPSMPVHPSPGHDADSLLNALAHYYHSTGQSHRVRPLYRLDQNTSGLIAVAKHRAAAGARLTKTYFALCEGRMEGTGTVNVPIGLGEDSKIRRVCGQGQRAVTHWQALAGDGSHTLLALTLETGRTHQIRAHLAYLGHPLAGDDLYGGRTDRIGRQALHCGCVVLDCPAVPFSGRFTAPFPPDQRRGFPCLQDDFFKEALLCPPV